MMADIRSQWHLSQVHGQVDLEIRQIKQNLISQVSKILIKQLLLNIVRS